MSTYLEILSIQRPFSFQVDENNRVMFSCNFEVMSQGPVNSFEEEMARVLSDASLGTIATDVFLGPAAVVPTGAGPFINIIDTGGTELMETHNGDIYEKLSFQVVVRGNNYVTTRTRAIAIWRALDGIRDTVLVPV